MTFSRISNGHYRDTETGVEFQSTWRFGLDYHLALDDISVFLMAQEHAVPHYKKCHIEIESARRKYGDFVYMYPVEWLIKMYCVSENRKNEHPPF